jgi:DNA polymerase III alpha subunit (gram-positive type)
MKLLNELLKGKRKAIFFDLEGTQLTQEVIAIGAIKAKLDSKGDIVSFDKKGFKIYVKSKGDIGSIVTKLTKITEKMLKEDGVYYHTAIQRFSAYVGKHPEEYVFIAYGNYDRTLICKTCSINQDDGEDFVKIVAKNYLDFAKFVTRFIKNSSNQTPSLIDAILALNGEPFDNTHDPLCDTQNLVLLYKLLKDNKKDLKEILKNSIMSSNLPTPVLNVLKKINSGQNVTPVDYEQYLNDYIK